MGAGEGFGTQRQSQIVAWRKTLEIVAGWRETLLGGWPAAADWHLVFEFKIPRRQKRPDLVLLARDVIFVIEMKVGATRFTAQDRWQAEDYALDLRDFHAGSAHHPVLPFLVITGEPEQAHEGQATYAGLPTAAVPQGLKARCVHFKDAARALLELYAAHHAGARPPLNAEEWIQARYQPTLNIIEAAEAIYREHSVREISHAFADNLAGTCDAIVEAIERAAKSSERLVCFVTGVPGSGKTLTGLSAAHDPRLRRKGWPPAVYLSGNGPLVRIVRAALARDHVRQEKVEKGEAKRRAATFIQIVHEFIGLYAIEQPGSHPPEHVIIFDEAQRGWNADQLKRKRGLDGSSEADLILEIMGRTPSWAVVVALVGGGQEINTGEAGLPAWGEALVRRQGAWSVIASPEVLPGAPPRAGGHLFRLEEAASGLAVTRDPRLHLATSVRSPRAQMLSDWVDCLVSGRIEEAAAVLRKTPDFPVSITRDLETARRWLRERGREDRRYGLVASSGALRLRSYGIEVSAGFRRGYGYEDWFLGGPDDIRSSYKLEVAATEFECQGLELDWVGVCWAGDLTWSEAGWKHRRFAGSRWRAVRQPSAQAFLLNKYRVLLTRSREGMIIWVPLGKQGDPTLSSPPLEATWKALLVAGAQPIEAV